MHRLLTVVAHELREMLPAFLFFLVVFHMLAATEAVLKGGHGISLLRSTAALVGALTAAKSVLLVNALPFARRYDRRPMAWAIAWKTLLFGGMTVLFHYLEELVPLVHRTGGLSPAWQELLREAPLAQVLVVQMWLWSAVLLFTTATEIVGRVGAARVRDELFRRIPPPDASVGPRAA